MRRQPDATPYKSVWIVIVLLVVVALAGLIYMFARAKTHAADDAPPSIPPMSATPSSHAPPPTAGH